MVRGIYLGVKNREVNINATNATDVTGNGNKEGDIFSKQ